MMIRANRRKDEVEGKEKKRKEDDENDREREGGSSDVSCFRAPSGVGECLSSTMYRVLYTVYSRQSLRCNSCMYPMSFFPSLHSVSSPLHLL